MRLLLLIGLVAGEGASAADPVAGSNTNTLPPPLVLTAQEDHQRMMDRLGIRSLRRGANPNNLQATNAVNYDEAKADPWPGLPDPLVLKNGRKVTTAEIWWRQRRPEIVEEFDREIYGRVPTNAPKVNWEVTSTTQSTNLTSSRLEQKPNKIEA